MELVLERIYSCKNYTIGKLFLVKEGSLEFICDTLEDCDRGLTNDMSLDEIKSKKIYGETAIPTGEYEINMNTISHKFKNRYWAKPFEGIIPRIENVKGYDGILFHVGNYPSDTYGCILVGENKLKGMVLNSINAFNKLMNDYLLPNKNNKIKIIIKRNYIL